MKSEFKVQQGKQDRISSDKLLGLCLRLSGILRWYTLGVTF